MIDINADGDQKGLNDVTVSVNLTDFYHMLVNHDWRHLTEIGKSEFQEGAEWYAKLKVISAESPDHTNLMDKFEKHILGKGDKPEEPKNAIQAKKS